MLYAALNNCAFVSTEFLKHDPSKPFAFLMDASMLGVGLYRAFGLSEARFHWVSSLLQVLDSTRRALALFWSKGPVLPKRQCFFRSLTVGMG